MTAEWSELESLRRLARKNKNTFRTPSGANLGSDSLRLRTACPRNLPKLISKYPNKEADTGDIFPFWSRIFCRGFYTTTLAWAGGVLIET